MNTLSLKEFNPWWTTGTLKEEWNKAFKRFLYAEVERYIERRQMILIHGLRRMGKTILLFQIIKQLLDRVQAKNVLYFSFDEQPANIRDVLDTYQQGVFGSTFGQTQERIFIFFDEIQKVKDWESTLKVYYDLHPNLKFFISGSASAKLRKHSCESLAGRVFDFVLPPLSFEEFLSLRNVDVAAARKNLALWENELRPLVMIYLKFGTFPELVHENDENVARKYISESVVGRIIYKDIPEEFSIHDTTLLKTLLTILSQNPAMLINYHQIARDLGRDPHTISNYLSYMEYSALITFVFNYRGSPLASLRKLKKTYFTTPNFVFALNQNADAFLPQLLEHVVALKTGATFFYKNGYEVDFVLVENKRLIAIEAKSGHVTIRQLKRFRKKFGKHVKNTFIVNLEKEDEEDGIKIVPAWKWLME